MFRGREMQHPELGRKILDQVAEAVAHVGQVEVYPKQDGRNMVMVLGPDKKAQAAHAEEARGREPRPSNRRRPRRRHRDTADASAEEPAADAEERHARSTAAPNPTDRPAIVATRAMHRRPRRPQAPPTGTPLPRRRRGGQPN